MGGSWEKVFFFSLFAGCGVFEVENGSVDFLDVNVQDKTGRTPRVLAVQE